MKPGSSKEMAARDIVMKKKVLIVGGVAAGASAAARLRRLDENAEIIMFERGEHISFANCGLPYYVGGIIQQRKRLLVQTPAAMSRRFKIDVRVMNEVINIDPAVKKVTVKNLVDETTYEERYDNLVLAPGASPVIPPIRGIEQAHVFTVRNVPDSDIIKEYIDRQKPGHAVVIGAGYIGLEMAEVLHMKNIKVTIVEAGTQIMNYLDPEMAAIVQNYIAQTGINLLLQEKAVAVDGYTVKLESGTTLPADLVILGVGVKPEVTLALRAGLSLGKTGGILVNEYLQTSDPAIYAAGDAIQVKHLVTGEDTLIPLAGPANRQGWLVAGNIAGFRQKYSGAQGTGILKVLDMTVASTGANEKMLQQQGYHYSFVHIHPASHATYYPGSTTMSAKLLFSSDDGRILGAQIVGYDGVDKRMDVLATALRAGMTIFDLQELELSYAPPYSSAKDPVNMLGYAAGNIWHKRIQVISWDQVASRITQGAFLIDARTPAEVEGGSYPGAYNIPVDELRDRLEEIPPDKEVLVYCQQGLRSYIANRILLQNDFTVFNISGGYNTYRHLEKN